MIEVRLGGGFERIEVGLFDLTKGRGKKGREESEGREEGREKQQKARPKRESKPEMIALGGRRRHVEDHERW